MKAEKRRADMAAYLLAQRSPVSGGALSKRFGVSRQIIVQDISMLRERGYDILPTHYGYVMQSTPLTERTFKVFHSPEQTADELNLIVSLGGSVVDVYVWHKVFGKICAELGIYTPQHVEDFMKNVRDGTSSELMSITGGHHYHTVRADSDKTLDKIAVALRERGYFVDEE